MKKIIVLLLTIVSFSAVADTIWSGTTSIKYVYPKDTGFHFVVEYSNPLSTCNNGTRFKFDSEAPSFNAMVSTLLAAFMAGKKVNLAIDDTQSAECSAIVNRFRVYP